MFEQRVPYVPNNEVIFEVGGDLDLSWYSYDSNSSQSAEVDKSKDVLYPDLNMTEEIKIKKNYAIANINIYKNY